jgi:cell filamentation protein
LQDFHRALFGRVYPWAGEIRTVAIAKTDMFCLPQHISSYAAEVFSGLRKETYLRGLSRNDFADRLTHYFAEVNAVHPFREGNGRTQRAFFGQLGREAGWRLAWAGLEPGENVAASRGALRGDNALLRSMLGRLVVPPRG